MSPFAGIFRTLAVSVVLVLSSCIREDVPDGADLGPGDRLPDFSVTMDDGSCLATPDLAGTVSVLVFFNTGCPDCRQEMPVIQKLYDNWGEVVRIVCISREQGPDAIRSYWEENGLTLPFSAQLDRRVYSLFAVSGIPRIYVNSADLIIAGVYTDSPLASYEDLTQDIRGLLPSAGL